MHFMVLLSALVTCAAGVPSKSTSPKIEGRIFGGSNAYIENFPYQVSVQFGAQHKYSGSIISKNWVLTTAYMIQPALIPYYRVVAGSSTLKSQSYYRVVDYAKHDKFNEETYDYDVGLLKIDPEFPTKAVPKPIALMSAPVKTGDRATVSGWGATYFGGTPSRTLQWVAIDILDDQSCIKVYNNDDIPVKFTDSMICAGAISGGKDACTDDAGGPLVVNNKLAGIVSWGYERGCGVRGYPGVYTKVFAMRDWIRNKTGV